jgi:hypothetical protein
MAILSDKMLCDRKKYLAMKKAEETEEQQSQANRAVAGVGAKPKESREDLAILRAARKYKSSDKMVNIEYSSRFF